MHSHVQRGPRAIAALLAATLVAALALVGVGPSTTSAAAVPAAATASSGSLTWGVKESFRSYLAMPFAHGSTELLAGATTADGGAFRFSGTTADLDAATLGSASFTGGVHFSGHEGALDIVLSNPRVDVTSTSTATLYVDVTSKGYNGSSDIAQDDVAFATLALGTPSDDGTNLTWTAGATLTADGAAGFAGFYAAGTALDAVTFSAAKYVAPAPVADPTITVTPATDVDPAVENTFTVTGTGFVGDGAAYGAYVSIGTKDLWSGDSAYPGNGWLTTAWVRSFTDGTFSTTVTVPAGTFEAGTDYTVATSAAHGLSVTNRTLDAFAPITIKVPVEPAPEPTETTDPAPVFTPELEVFAADGTTPLGETAVHEGDEIVVKGTGYDPAANVGGRGVPIPSTLPQGTYVVLGSVLDTWQPSADAPASSRTSAVQTWALAESVLDQVPAQFQSTIRKAWAPIADDGSFTVRVTVTDAELESGSYGVYTYAAGGTKNADQEIFVPVNLTTEPVEPEPTDPPTTEPTDPPTTEPTDPPTTEPTPTTAGALTWGLKQSFRSYIASPVVHGTATTSAGATTTDAGLFRFPQSAGSLDGAKGSADYRGAVRFTGHDGLLDMSVSSPRVEITGSSSATLLLDVRSAGLDGSTFDEKGVKFATLDLSSAKRSVTNGATTWTGAPATLTAAGAEAFAGFYDAGTALDAVTFTVGADDTTSPGDGGSSGGGSSSGGNGSGDGGSDAAGVAGVATLSSTQVSPGDDVTISGVGFGANEKGLTSIIRSTPRTLATGVLADAAGAASATVTIPTDLEAGEHTLSLEGENHTVSATITVVAAPVAVEQCTARSVSGATLTWGVRDSFVAYITGPIAQGSVATEGTSQSGGEFVWSGGEGRFNTELTQGQASFGGAVHFTGHDGLLDLKISNVRVRVTSPTSGLLIADMASSDMEGTKSSQSGVAIASLNLSGHGGVSGAEASWTNVPATLTAAGAEAFAGFYSAGEALAPVSFTFPLGGEVACDPLSGSLASTGADGLTAAWVALGLMLLGGTALVARRRFSRAA